MFRVFITAVALSAALSSVGAGCAQAQTTKTIEISPQTDPKLVAPDILREGKQPSGLSETTPRGTAAEEVHDERIKQSESSPGLPTQRTPVSSIISANADLVISNDEVLLNGLRGLTVEVSNNTDRPLIFHGELASVTIGGTKLTAAPRMVLDNISSPVPTLKGKMESVLYDTAVAGVSIGGVPALQDGIRQGGPVLDRYGHDETRREDELTSFGKRIVWPGDKTSGVVFFITKQSLKGDKVDMPVSSLFDKADQGSLSKQH